MGTTQKPEVNTTDQKIDPSKNGQQQSQSEVKKETPAEKAVVTPEKSTIEEGKTKEHSDAEHQHEFTTPTGDQKAEDQTKKSVTPLTPQK